MLNCISLDTRCGAEAQEDNKADGLRGSYGAQWASKRAWSHKFHILLANIIFESLHVLLINCWYNLDEDDVFNYCYAVKRTCYTNYSIYKHTSSRYVYTRPRVGWYHHPASAASAALSAVCGWDPYSTYVAPSELPHVNMNAWTRYVDPMKAKFRHAQGVFESTISHQDGTKWLRNCQTHPTARSTHDLNLNAS